MNILHLFLTLMTVTVSLSGQVLIKSALNQVRELGKARGQADLIFIATHLIVNKYFLLGFVAMGGGALLYFTLLYHVDVSRALPVMGAMAYIIMFLVAALYLKEDVNRYQFLGLVCLIAGIALISHKPAAPASPSGRGAGDAPSVLDGR